MHFVCVLLSVANVLEKRSNVGLDLLKKQFKYLHPFYFRLCFIDDSFDIRMVSIDHKYR